MKYIADLLAVLRVLLAFSIIVVVVTSQMYGLATILFIVGVLTDAFDGSAARRWPYSEQENQSLWWRKGHGQVADNVADALLFYGALFALGISNPGWWVFGALATVGSAVLNVLIHALRSRQSGLADKIDVGFRWGYGIVLFAILVGFTANALQSLWWTLGFTVMYIVVGAVVVYVKRDRALVSR